MPARSAINVAAGAQSPLASIVSALILLSIVLAGTDWLARLPLAVLAANIPGASVGAFVTGAADPATLRAAQLALPAAVYPFAVRCAASLGLARRRVGDLIVLDVAALADLPVALRSLR